MGEPILNLSAWIDRRRKEVGPYADHIVHSVKAYEARITSLDEENARLREALIRIEDLTSHNMGMSDREERVVNKQARAALEGE